MYHGPEARAKSQQPKRPRPQADLPLIGLSEAAEADDAPHSDNRQHDVGYCRGLFRRNARE
jgi:hypothetical protein